LQLDPEGELVGGECAREAKPGEAVKKILALPSGEEVQLQFWDAFKDIPVGADEEDGLPIGGTDGLDYRGALVLPSFHDHIVADVTNAKRVVEGRSRKLGVTLEFELEQGVASHD
jgi:hypothetical protein